jgi:hypothetical protein
MQEFRPSDISFGNATGLAQTQFECYGLYALQIGNGRIEMGSKFEVWQN